MADRSVLLGMHVIVETPMLRLPRVTMYVKGRRW
jgi:hypothetical protein